MGGNASTPRRCAFCGYDTTGVAAAGTFACPECGTHLDAVHGPFLKSNGRFAGHVLKIAAPALVTGAVLVAAIFALMGCLAWKTSGAFASEVAPLVALIVVIVMLAGLAVGLGYAFRATDALKLAYVPRQSGERWWWYNIAVISGFLFTTSATAVLIMGGLLLTVL